MLNYTINIIKYFKQRNSSCGYTLLEYVAGAAILAGIVWLALNTMGDSLKNLLEGLGNWLEQQAPVTEPGTTNN